MPPTLELRTAVSEQGVRGFIRPFEHQLGVVSRAFDLTWIVVALYVSLRIAGWGWDERYTVLAAASCALFLLAAEAANVYNNRRSAPLRFDFRNLAAAWSVTIVGVLFLAYALQVSHLYSRLGLTIWMGLAPVTLVTWRGITRAGLTRARSLGYNSRRVAIVGAGEQGRQIARIVLDAPWMGLDLVGLFDDRTPAHGRVHHDLPCELLGRTDDLPIAIAERHIDIVYVALPISNQERIVRILNMLSDTTVSLYFVPDNFLVSMFHGRWVHVGDLPAVSVFETPFFGIGGWIKRAEDLVLGSILTAIAAVPMLCIGLAVRLESPGPILFKQRRYGLDGQEFRIWKFRTMKTLQDGDDVPQAQRGDPRLTRIGGFLRRTSLDELPQLLNVLGGSMSIVGPRPHASAHNEFYRRVIPHYMVRHKVRPGISGWAQANGWRGETDTLEKMRARVEYDLWYIRNWSVLLDLKILLVTLLMVWRSDDAY
jgi:putative colanic acid biosynthesis UDP-glucose lipid carrier transferase